MDWMMTVRGWPSLDESDSCSVAARGLHFVIGSGGAPSAT